MLHNKLVGMGVALVTPFKTDGSVNFEMLGKLVDFQIENDTNYLVVCGTTSEVPTLTQTEQEEITRFVVERVAGRIPIVVGIGGNNTAQIVQNVINTNFQGIDAILSVVPYYNKPSQEGLYQHYKAIATATDMPIILYNVPSRTGTNMSAQTTLRLANDFKNIVAIKEASCNFEQIKEIIDNKPQDFMVISGDDGVALPLIKEGAVGVISVIANAFPREFGQMVRLALNGDFDNAQEIDRRFTELIKLLFVDGSPSGIKSVLSELGMIEDVLRLPLVPATAATKEKIRKVLNISQ